ncbi:MAG: hypothetical protein KF689_07530 [Gemmatimonadaceae bacterium]|nr:hypothetical protein [Gemmatimonadaceae bacterium]MCW5824979.1 hypothetical protein [Gemmatimonadaceae bacterium]
MPRRFRTAWSLAALALAAVLGACSEDLQTGGACPTLCPGQGIVVRDTVINPAIVFDTNLVGFPLQGSEDPLLLADRPDTLDVRMVVRYDSLTRVFRRVNDDTLSQIDYIDSAYVTLFLTATNVPTPAQWFIDAYDVYDSTLVDTIPSAVLPLFTPGRFLGTYQGDTAFTDTLRVQVPIDTAYLRVLLNTEERRLRVGFRVRSASSVQFNVRPIESGDGPVLTYLPSAVDTIADPDTLARTRFTTQPNSLFPRVPLVLGSDLADYQIVVQATSEIVPNTFTVGGLPGSRAYLRFELPAWLTDSVGVLRAQLELSQHPVTGPSSSDTLRLDGHLVVATGVVTDLRRAATILSGAGVYMQSTFLIANDSSNVRILVNPLVRLWNTNNTAAARPTAIILRISDEGGTPTALRFHSMTATDPALRPRLRVSYVPAGILGQP